MHQKSFTAFGFGAGSTIGSMTPSRRGSQINVNVTPSQTMEGVSETPEIRKYKKRFSSDILCAALWGEYLHFYHFYCCRLYSFSVFLMSLHCCHFNFLPVALKIFLLFPKLQKGIVIFNTFDIFFTNPMIFSA